ncbi:MAG: 16S rRNA (cytosine(1402)-N(4))-methyltransferase [Candidatus Woykebacteria bacterium GWB1_45_5]|uniref:Ribosomal RNA small subunit methyltransferase H n=2 Tax=Candidatus Woykeibacteriota TaxID=1817899 RepID=A0A1G1W1Z4_9BACT|nr:MAG: 16S rRNA (cytosine(1402)-N(4))-methyltransferase [Candidatus Woykebacteria bacterium GWA1_44_8]OGY23050.1 MAG: 16S rRNA (cytosine(1402)-N(4))-methyltransferase [Candidatus Woykebacteria bacterium GWB1_45_5]
MVKEKHFHKSVLKREVLEALNIKKDDIYIDATVGGGGHTKAILELGGKVLATDIDPEAVRYVAEIFSIPLEEKDGRLSGKGKRLILTQGNFANLARTAREFGVGEAAGVLFDLGVSSHQLDSAERGFSFSKDAPLDMRMDQNLSVTAADLINGLNEGELYELFSKYGEESNSRRIARAVIRSRIERKIETTKDLVETIEHVVGGRGKIHPATKVFQALRIAVNDELNNLKKGLEEATSLLKKGGRLVVISFHSLEDRLVKNFFRQREDLQVLTQRPIVPTREEILENPRARSAKMRVAEKQ